MAVVCRLWERGVARLVSQSRMSSSFAVTVHDKTGVATLSMQRKPVNSLDTAMMREMTATINQLQANKCRGLILTSSLPKIFSAGLDLVEIYRPTEERLREFWSALQDLYFTLYGSHMVSVAAINGSSPAAGCLLATLCDARIMQDGPFVIGPNETNLGVKVPFWVQEVLINTMGHRESERALQLGRTYSPQDALRVGLVDGTASAEHLQETAQAEMNLWLRIPAEARILTKLQIRQPLMERLVARRQEDIDHFVDFITRADIQQVLEGYIAKLNAAAAKQQAKKKKEEEEKALNVQ